MNGILHMILDLPVLCYFLAKALVTFCRAMLK